MSEMDTVAPPTEAELVKKMGDTGYNTPEDVDAVEEVEY